MSDAPDRRAGVVVDVLGPVVRVRLEHTMAIAELVWVGDDRLYGEVIGLDGDTATLQVYESTAGLQSESVVVASGHPLRVRLGPVNYRQFCDFLPSGTAFRPLADLARLYGGKQFDIDVQVVLLAAEVPWCSLSGSAEDGARLGWNTWIRNRDFSDDALDAVFTVQDN